jgi:SAM-dependent methyltransferase
MKHTDINKIYQTMLPESIPWNLTDPPEVLTHLVKEGIIPPCKTVDLGCGMGNYAIYLAKEGFDVTGIDISAEAIRLASENAEKTGVMCNFIVGDLCRDWPDSAGNFGFAYDYEVLHHIYPRFRKKYIENVSRLLKPGAYYLSVCFSVKDPYFGGTGKYRKTPIGTVLYFSSENELKRLFQPLFTIIESKTIEVKGKTVSHMANYFLMKRNVSSGS